MYRYNRYSCLYLVPRDEYDYLKSNCENNQSDDDDDEGETFSSPRANNDGGKDIHQVNNIRVTKGANVIIRGERDQISTGTAPSHNYGEGDGEEENRGLDDGDVSQEEWRRRREEGEEEEKKEELAKKRRKKNKKRRNNPPVIGENVRFPLVREEAQVHSELPLQMKRAGDISSVPYWTAPSNQGRGVETNSSPYYYNNHPPPPPTGERRPSYSYTSSTPSSLLNSTINSEQQASEGDVTMRTVSSYPSSRSPSSKISSTRSARTARRESASSLSTPPSSRGRRRTSSSSSSSIAPPSSTSSKVSLKPPTLVLPLPDKDEPMPLAASGVSSAVSGRPRANRDYLRQIIADRLETLRGKKRKPASSVASSQGSASLRPPPVKRATPKYEFPLGKRRNPFQERTARKKKALPVINESSEDE